MTWELSLEVLRRSDPSLAPGASHSFKASLCTISLKPLGKTPGQDPGQDPPKANLLPHSPGQIRSGRGAPVKHTGCKIILMSSAKQGARTSMCWICASAYGQRRQEERRRVKSLWHNLAHWSFSILTLWQRVSFSLWRLILWGVPSSKKEIKCKG